MTEIDSYHGANSDYKASFVHPSIPLEGWPCCAGNNMLRQLSTRHLFCSVTLYSQHAEPLALGEQCSHSYPTKLCHHNRRNCRFCFCLSPCLRSSSGHSRTILGTSFQAMGATTGYRRELASESDQATQEIWYALPRNPNMWMLSQQVLLFGLVPNAMISVTRRPSK
jgi:hypothetical protein